MEIMQNIPARIYEIRGERVMIDRDLAILYETESRMLNQAVKRNLKRFPPDFMFQLTKDEVDALRFQIETSNKLQPEALRSQFVISKGGNRYLPYAFTEQGVAMLSGILNSDKAINMNIAIMRAFVEVRKLMATRNELSFQLEELRSRIGDHDLQLNQIYEAM
ncbi:ORF6N domain-containing protein [Pseudoflavitalea sp. G-6-1-2]|uniref:ORF6N domain-containing protein n=1 Tax=Pseudoflavitalea sp. G-6-1-2 TaxID=2728841 RepID=UPI00146F2EC5|nr:ORF6N domain-containing protein [Pseudoflavitalea sp. G-6-1-2]NML22105.1 ORF6N domain-containing protein [Pseudoflavitalea sp. G-6-1-2]